jgi:hypothetical protein
MVTGMDRGRAGSGTNQPLQLSIHLVPVLFGSGLRMFENLGERPIHLENTDSIHTPAATHLHFRITK